MNEEGATHSNIQSRRHGTLLYHIIRIVGYDTERVRSGFGIQQKISQNRCPNMCLLIPEHVEGLDPAKSCSLLVYYI